MNQLTAMLISSNTFKLWFYHLSRCQHLWVFHIFWVPSFWFHSCYTEVKCVELLQCEAGTRKSELNYFPVPCRDLLSPNYPQICYFLCSLKMIRRKLALSDYNTATKHFGFHSGYWGLCMFHADPNKTNQNKMKGKRKMLSQPAVFRSLN